MKKRTFWQKVGDFLNGKGFYMALAVCVCAIGLSGWYLWQAVTAAGENVSQAVNGEATVTVTGDQEDTVPPEQTSSETINSDAINQDSEATSAAQTDDTQDNAADALSVSDDPEAAETIGKSDGKGTSDSKDSAAEPQESDNSASESTSGSAESVGNSVETVDNLHQTMQYPVPGQVVTAFSADELVYNEVMEDWRTHNGVDLSAQEGDQVVAAWSGKVTSVKEDAVLGVTVTVDCGDGYTTLYGNLAENTNVSAGDEVAAGDPIGTVGTTAAGELGEGENFLHFSVSKDGEYLDPTQFFTANGES